MAPWALLGLVLAGLAPGLRAAESWSDALEESRVFGYAKAMYVADDKKGGRPNQSTLGVGGKLGVATGEFQGFSLLGAWYATSDLGLRSHDPRRTDAYMFDLDKRPYQLWGEAQLIYRQGEARLVLGRQEILSPLVNSYDYRIIPNLFEAATLSLPAGADTRLTLAYLKRMSGLDGLVSFSEFRSMSQQAYTSLMLDGAGRVDGSHGETLDLSRVVGHRGAWLAGLVHERGDYRLQLWNSFGRDTLNTLYGDGRLRHGLEGGAALVLEAQAYQVRAVGGFRDYLARLGLNADYGLWGLKGSYEHQPWGLRLSLAHNRFGGDGRTVTAYGNWGGYPEFVSMPYLYAEQDKATPIARSRLSRLTLGLDLGPYGLQGHSLLWSFTRIDPDAALLPGGAIRVHGLLWRARLTPELSARLQLEARNSGKSRYDNEFAALSLRYDF